MSVTIDLHHHVVPDFYWQASNEGGEAAGGITPPRWSLDGALAYLDEAEIDAAVASISTPGVNFGDDAAARALARRTNESRSSRDGARTALGRSPSSRSRTSRDRCTSSSTRWTRLSSTACR
jgi:hypothetical protein